MTAAALALWIASHAPSFPEPSAAAQLVTELATEYRLDPELLARYVHSESRWEPSAEHVNSTDVYVGLGQIRLRNYPECRDLQSPECQEKRAALSDWRTNLAETARWFVVARGYCKEVVRVSGARYWLQVVTGWDLKRRTLCGRRRSGRALPIPDPVRALLRSEHIPLHTSHAANHKRSRIVITD